MYVYGGCNSINTLTHMSDRQYLGEWNHIKDGRRVLCREYSMAGTRVLIWDLYPLGLPEILVSARQDLILFARIFLRYMILQLFTRDMGPDMLAILVTSAAALKARALV